jgi:hypothetical protein
MLAEAALIRLREDYLAAVDDEERLAAIWHFRARHAEPPPDAEPELLRSVFEALLRRSVPGVSGAQLVAARLIRSLWLAQRAETVDLLLHDVTRLLLDAGPSFGDEERMLLRQALEHGCEQASPAALEHLCLALTDREVGRHLPPASTVVPDLETMRLIVRYAPSGIWPRLVGDLWRLYRPRFLRMEGQERSPHWREIGRHLLRRTLAEARPEDLGDTFLEFSAAIEDPARSVEAEFLNLLEPLTRWPIPPVLRLLERLARQDRHHPGYSPSTHGQAAVAAARVRARLEALGTAVAPAGVPQAAGTEVAPAPGEHRPDGGRIGASAPERA